MIIIIGSGIAAWNTVRELRKLETAQGKSAQPVTIICADSGDFYAKPSLSNALGQKRNPAQLVTTPAAKMVEAQKVTLIAHTKVEKIDRALRHVFTDKGDFSYTQLVLATGAYPIRVPVKGDADHKIYSVNSLDDFVHFYAVLEGVPKHVAIMGAGLIGCEFANDLVLGGHTVSVIDPAPRALAALIDKDTSLALQAKLQAIGVRWHFGTTLQTATQNATQLDITLANGQALHADLILSAVGLRPNITLAADAGLATDRGIVVNAYLQTSDPSIYALGDCTQYDFIQGKIKVLPYIMPVMQASKALAQTLVGNLTAVKFPAMPVRVKTPTHPITVASPV